jgi:monoamine oxidase
MPETITLQGNTLPPELVWTNRYNQSKVVQITKFALDGTMIIQTAAKKKGTKITLSGEEIWGSMTRSQVEELVALANTPGQVMSLDYKGDIRSVVFDHEKGAISLQGWVPDPIESAQDVFIVKEINLIEV